MGVNKSKVSNRTGHILHIINFSNTELLYWNYREMRQPPADGREITVDGLAGGAAVQVGVIFNRVDGRHVYDLFRVSHGVTLTIRAITMESGVRNYDQVEGVEFMEAGKTIRMTADRSDGVMRGVQMASTAAGAVTNVGNVGKMIAGAIPS